jgi:hypothetical protein
MRPRGRDIQAFDILFDSALYLESSLTSVSPPEITAVWDELILTSAPGLPAFYDVQALTGNDGIAPGATVSGFAVEFTWLGDPAGPGIQPFLIYDLDDLGPPLLQVSTVPGASIYPFST